MSRIFYWDTVGVRTPFIHIQILITIIKYIEKLNDSSLKAILIPNTKSTYILKKQTAKNSKGTNLADLSKF